jgi:cytochrome c
MKISTRTAGYIVSIFSIVFSSAAWSGIDIEAAKALAKKEGCFKCHGIDEKKEGKSLQDIAKKFKGKANANATMLKQITTGAIVKLDDGSEEEHKIAKSKDMEALGNMLDWIRSLAK